MDVKNKSRKNLKKKRKEYIKEEGMYKGNLRKKKKMK